MPPESSSHRGPATAEQKQRISALAQQGDSNEARRLCTTLCEKHPDDPESWFLLGAINGALADYPQAERCCRRALELVNEHPVLRYNLAIALVRQGKTAEAISQFEYAIAAQPGYADAYRELGNALRIAGQPLQALVNYRKSHDLDPSNAITLHNLGCAYQKLNRLDEATESLKKAIALQPDFIESYCELATTLIQQFKFDAAIELLESASGRLTDATSLYPLLATAYQEHGDADIAKMYYQKTLDANPDSINAKVGIAGILALQGKYRDARDMLEPLLLNNPEHATAKCTFATFAHYFGEADRGIAVAEQEIGNPEVPPRTKAKFHFALAQILERKDELDAAFEHYATGNRLRGAEFNRASYERMFQALMDNYSAEALSGLARSDNQSDAPIFIFGVPRSGTSLAEQILASHSEVYGGGELRNINGMVDKLSNALGSRSPYPLCLSLLTTDTLNNLAGQYLEDLRRRCAGTASYYTDKMPANFMHLGFISLLFPKARLIHCTRDPRDSLLSCYFKMFSGEHPYAYSLTDLGHFYRLYSRLMTHWKSVLTTPIYELNYENLVLNQEMETRKLLDHCGLDWQEECLQFHKTDRTVATASHDQVRQPLYVSSIGRWRAYEKHLSPLFDALRIGS
jgi:tetratricopeptide (TPR) repeat protein